MGKNREKQKLNKRLAAIERSKAEEEKNSISGRSRTVEQNYNSRTKGGTRS